jgi:hypothetical protein
VFRVDFALNNSNIPWRIAHPNRGNYVLWMVAVALVMPV